MNEKTAEAYRAFKSLETESNARYLESTMGLYGRVLIREACKVVMDAPPPVDARWEDLRPMTALRDLLTAYIDDAKARPSLPDPLLATPWAAQESDKETAP